MSLATMLPATSTGDVLGVSPPAPPPEHCWGRWCPFGGIAGWALGQGAAQIGSSAAQLAFSKDEEREADYLSGYLVARAGYDLDRAGLVWMRLTRDGPNETAGWLDSHPAGPERLAAWRNTIDEVRASSDLVPRRSGQ
jgi:predicted Zn-dependent protease